MTTTETTDEASASWPESWTPGAVDAAETVLEQRPDLAGAEWASLMEAAAMITAADHLDEVAAAESYVSKGSTGQTIVHPAVVEARLNRTAAATILARLFPAHGGRMSPSAKGRAGAAARWASPSG